jgi:hypothetical protein
MEYYIMMEMLKELSTKELKRILKSSKEYLVLDAHIFNVGEVIKPILTNDFNKYKNVMRDGYSCILYIDYELIATIEEILENK